MGWAILCRRSGEILVRRNGPVEAEEDRSEVSFRPFAGIWLGLLLDIDDEGGIDHGEQASLGTWSMLYIGKGMRTGETYENQGGVEILVILLHVFGLVLHHLWFAQGMEIERGSLFLMGWGYIRKASWVLSWVSLSVVVVLYRRGGWGSGRMV